MKRFPLFLVLAIGLLGAQQAMAQSNLKLRAIGASAALVNPENLDNAFGFGVFADMGQIAPRIGLEPTLEYWSKSEDAFGASASLRDLSIGARGKYYFDTANPKVRPFAGAGLGLHFLRAEATVNVPGFGTVTSDASDTKLGLDLGGGVATAVSPKDDLHVEGWFGVVSDMNQFALRVGLSHKLGL